KLVRHYACSCVSRNPTPNCRDFFVFALESLNCRRRSVEDRNRIAPVITVAIHVGDNRAEQPVRLSANLMGSTIVDTQGARPTSDINAERLPREWLLEDALAEIASEEQGIRSQIFESGEKPNMSDTNILCLVHHREIEDHLLGFRDCCRKRREQLGMRDQALRLQARTDAL